MGFDLAFRGQTDNHAAGLALFRFAVIRDGLSERFGARAPRLASGDTIISEGAAWIAHDDLRLGLAKPIELLQSDGTYAAVVPLPYVLPIENQTLPAASAIYHCVDPRSGRASFTFARPNTPQPRDAKSDRQTYATLHLEVDAMADPLMERLELKLAIDHDYVAHVDLRSTMRTHHVIAEIFDLEFTVQFPGAAGGLPASLNRETAGEKVSGSSRSTHSSEPAGSICLRSNIACYRSWQMVPGDLIETYRSNWFADRARQYSAWQKKERDYYKDCPYCQRQRYEFHSQGCNNSYCLWIRVYHEKPATGPREYQQ